jgi:rod shape-determining protein MreC
VLRPHTGKVLVLLAIFVVLSGATILLDRQGLLDPIKRPAERLIAPVTSTFGSMARGRESDSEAEMAAIIAERDYYRSEAMRLQNAESENTQLRQQLGIEQKYTDFEVIPAGVLARDPSNSQKFITIDKGSDDGVMVGQAVVDPNNYVGQITEVGPTQSRVTLLIDTQASPLSVEIVDGGDGMLYGMWQAGGRAEMRYVDLDANPQPGDAVLTSSDGVTQSRGVPGGLLIGTVGPGIQSDPLSDEITVPVIPNADFENLEVVTVILGPREGTGATSVTPNEPVPSGDEAGDATGTDADATEPASSTEPATGDGTGGAPASDPNRDETPSGDADPSDEGSGGTDPPLAG